VDPRADLSAPQRVRWSVTSRAEGTDQEPDGSRLPGGDGGDEETRTPDPLLAKEMLYQLSYVPELRTEWWAFLDSNQRPLPYQGSALTS
jgi:hypothetical protein